jgi:hypothetical protein
VVAPASAAELIADVDVGAWGGWIVICIKLTRRRAFDTGKTVAVLAGA